MVPLASSRPPRRQRPQWQGTLTVALLLAAAAALPARAAFIDPQPGWDPQSYIDLVYDLKQIGDTMDQAVEELGYGNIKDLLDNLPELLLKGAILEAQHGLDPGLGYLTGPCTQDSAKVEDMYQSWMWGWNTYEYYDSVENGTASPELLERLTGIPRGSMLKISSVDTLSILPYWILADHANKRIVCTIRGSVSPSDWFLDYVAQTRVISPGVGAHDGMTHVTENILNDVADTILAFASENPDYTLHFNGHSLGAGVCALASYLVKEGLLSGVKLASLAGNVTGGCAATPAVLTMNAASTMDYVYTFRYKIDMVPSSSLINFIDLLKSIQDVSTQDISPPVMRAAVAKLEDLLNSTGLSSEETADFLSKWRMTARDGQVAQREAFKKFMEKYGSVPGAGDCGPGANRRLLRKGRLPGPKPAANCSEPAVERRAVDTDIHTDTKSVPLEYEVGSVSIWPMYAPGILYQATGDKCVLTASGPEERWNFVVMDPNMIAYHRVLPDLSLLL